MRRLSKLLRRKLDINLLRYFTDHIDYYKLFLFCLGWTCIYVIRDLWFCKCITDFIFCYKSKSLHWTKLCKCDTSKRHTIKAQFGLNKQRCNVDVLYELLTVAALDIQIVVFFSIFIIMKFGTSKSCKCSCEHLCEQSSGLIWCSLNY